MEPTPSTPDGAAEAPGAKRARLPVWKIGGFLLAALVYLVVTTPRVTNAPGAVLTRAVSQAQAIGAVLAKYAADHGGKYPDGKTSTEVFQALIDQNYLTDRSILYYPMPGKRPATTNQLQPENVCWDLTEGVDADSPPTLPVVFSTGFAVAFQPGARPGIPPISWWQGWNDHTFARDFIALCDRAGSGKSVYTGGTSEVAFMPQDIDLKNRTYRQLTPTGTIPPLQ
jgi:hypothetical protein